MFSYSDLKLWAELLDYSCEFDRSGKVYLQGAYTTEEFDSLEDATKFILPLFLQEQAS